MDFLRQDSQLIKQWEKFKEAITKLKQYQASLTKGGYAFKPKGLNIMHAYKELEPYLYSDDPDLQAQAVAELERWGWNRTTGLPYNPYNIGKKYPTEITPKYKLLGSGH